MVIRLVVALALRLHAHRHGAFPATLAELVPALLDAVPADPFDDSPVRYELTDEGCHVGHPDTGIDLSR